MNSKQASELRKVAEEIALEALTKLNKSVGLSDDPEEAVDPERLDAALMGAALLISHIEGLVRSTLPPELQGSLRAFIDQMSKKVGDMLQKQAADETKPNLILPGGSNNG